MQEQINEFPQHYNAAAIEKKWYDFWSHHRFFEPQKDAQKGPFCIILPPPNITGQLHMGHAFDNVAQDILIRTKRMQGYKTVWIPGTDHAGISTQAVVERYLYEKTKKRKSDFTKEEFLKEIWQWREEKERIIIEQLKKIGSSLDWSRLKFTMDQESTHAVKVMFKKLYDNDLIYQGDYLIHWDPLSRTAIADIEVEYEMKPSFLWYLRYPIEGSSSFLVVATTRPETIFGDSAVAVSPKDDRYTQYVGKYVRLPFTHRIVPIIAHPSIDPHFGSGAVKITPAHDFHDYEIARHHQPPLPMINILRPDGTLNEEGMFCQGMNVEEARKTVVQSLRHHNLLEKIEPYQVRKGFSYRSKAVIEPYLSKQWFIHMQPFKEKLLKMVELKKIRLIPEEWEHVYLHWIHNLRDWCISRQLWWGHRIPVWHHKENPKKKICFIGEGRPQEVADQPNTWEQDPDVLDTWFSSALWPLITLGWPKKTKDFSLFYPMSTLVSGHDILFFWVARMIFMGEYALSLPPFSEIFVHGLIFGKSYWRKNHNNLITYVTADERKNYEMGGTIPKDVLSKWEKMSKSKGNVIDPMDIITEYGSDSMRLALADGLTHAKQIDLDRRKFEEYKYVTTKLWNATRFLFSHISDDGSFAFEEWMQGIVPSLFTLEDRWILSRISRLIDEIDSLLSRYAFHDLVQKCCFTFWEEFCSHYLELIKPYFMSKEGNIHIKKNKKKLSIVLFIALIRLMHPIMPFVTEECFSLIKKKLTELPEVNWKVLQTHFEKIHDPYLFDLLCALNSQACIITSFPRVWEKKDLSESIEKQFSFLQEAIYVLRKIRAELHLPPKQHIDAFLYNINTKEADFFQKHQFIISTLANVQNVTILRDSFCPLQRGSTAFFRGINVFVPTPIEYKEKEMLRMRKELEKTEERILFLQKKLDNKCFLSRAPQELIKKIEEEIESLHKIKLLCHKKLESLA